MARRVAAGVGRRVRARVQRTASTAPGTAPPAEPAPGAESDERLARRVDAIGRLLGAKPPGAR